jgi:putative SOS response-associated peptidase YedK
MEGVCGRYVSARTEPDLIDDYMVSRVDVTERPQRHYNVAPTDAVYVVLPAEGGRVLTVARWGLVPSWARDRSGAARLVNARVETVADKPAFRSALRRRRCLVPADGYYEWVADGVGGKRPYLLRAADGGFLTFAGLYEVWRDPRDDGQDGRLTTVSIVTAPATGVAATVHDRMPVVLSPAAFPGWLDPATGVERALAVLADAAAAQELVAAAANRAVGDVRNDGEYLLVPEAEPEAEAEPAPLWS